MSYGTCALPIWQVGTSAGFFLPLDRAERAQPDSLVAPAFPHARDDGARDHLAWPVYSVDAVDAYL